MRKSILLPLLVVACGEPSRDPGHTVIPGFLDRSVPVACEPTGLAAAATELRGATDTTVLVLDAPERRITEYRDDLTPLWTLEYAETGPAAISRPVSAGLLGDTAVAVAARGGLQLVIVDRAGSLIRSEPLTFIPSALATTGAGHVLVTPMPVGDAPGTLLVRFRDGELEELPVPKRPYADMTVGALGNATLVETFPDGWAIVVHQFFAPRAFRVELDDDDDPSVSPLAVPTPDATAALVPAVPRAPVTEDQFREILVPAIAMGVDRARGQVFLLTRSGRSTAAGSERAVLRLDRELRYVSSYILDVHAVHMAVLPRRNAALVADDMDRFFLCPLHADAHAE